MHIVRLAPRPRALPIVPIGRLVCVSLLAVVTFAACSGRDHGKAPPRIAWDLRLPLSPAERAYLQSLPVLRIGVDPGWAPMAFVDRQGRLDGISADYLDFLQDTLRVRFQLVPTRSWAETVRFANEGRIDIVVAASKFDGLAPGFSLSTPYVRYPLVIVTRATAPFIAGLEDLEGAQIATVGDAQTIRLRLADLPHVHPVTVGSAEEGLEAVAQARAFAYIGNLGVIDRLVRGRYEGTLRVAAPADRMQELSFGVAPRYAPLLPLIDRVLSAIPEMQREQIQNSWLSTRFTFGVAPHTLWLVLAPVGTLTLAFFIVLWFNMVRLRNEVRHRRQTERELVFETRFKTLLMNTVPIPICVKDEQGRYLAVNPAYEQALGVRADRLVGALLPPPGPAHDIDVEALGPVARRVIETGRSARGEIDYLGPDGQGHEAVYWARLCSSEGHQAAVLCAFVDVSDLRRMERRELELKRRLVELTQALPSVVFQLRFARTPKPRFELLFANRRADELLEPRHAGEADTFELFMRALDRTQRRRLTRIFLRSAQLQEGVRSEFVVDRGGAGTAWFHVEAAPGRREDGSVEWSGYLHEVTQAKQAQAALMLAKHEAEEAARARDSFIATVSHEIRTPMSGIVSILQLLDHQGLSADDRQLVDMAANAAQILLRILNDILDFAKMEDGELSLESAAMSIEAIVDQATGLVAPEIDRKGLHLRVDVARAVAARHIGDAQRIGQVLLNLLGNAVKFTERGEVSVTVDVASETDTLQWLRLRIADTGIGISREDQARLFVPFSQARGTLGGTGLGLAICKRLVEQMGGAIALESVPRQGTTVSLTLPLPIERAATAATAATPAPSRGGNVGTGAGPRSPAHERILLVEDQLINREVLRRQLASLHVLDCHVADNGVQALQALERHRYAMVITDCAMPQLDGVGLMTRIRQRELGTLQRTVLIALTADATQRQRDACLAAGADEVCLKPLALERLRELLTRYGIGVTASAAPAQSDMPMDSGTADLRQALRQTLADEMNALRALSLPREKAQASALLHRMRGAAAWFQLGAVADAVAQLESRIEHGVLPLVNLNALQQAIDQAVEHALHSTS